MSTLNELNKYLPENIREQIEGRYYAKANAQANLEQVKRDPYRLKFMKGFGVAMAYLHDVGMMDFTTFGRAMHGEFASQEVMSADFDDILTAIWDQNWSNMPWELVNLELKEPRLTMHEMLAMGNCHRKSRVPTEILNDPRKLRAQMQHCPASDLRCLYLQEQIEKAKRKLTED